MEQYKDFTFIALASLDVILIVILEPTVMILEKIERPAITKEGSAPNICWGMGSIPGLKNKTIFKN